MGAFGGQLVSELWVLSGPLQAALHTLLPGDPPCWGRGDPGRHHTSGESAWGKGPNIPKEESPLLLV